MYLPARHTRFPIVWIFDAPSDRLIGRVPIAAVDLRTVDEVARRCCAAKRDGLRPTLRGTTPGFYALLDLAGLVGALRIPPPPRRADGRPPSDD